VGKFTFHVLGSLGEFVRDIIQENTRAGLVAARARGRLGGAPRALSPQREKEAVALLEQGKNLGEVAVIFNVSKKTTERTEKRAKQAAAPTAIDVQDPGMAAKLWA
jgi:DNA invertase Pin-like site-specific DNA recombinase